MFVIVTIAVGISEGHFLLLLLLLLRLAIGVTTRFIVISGHDDKIAEGRGFERVSISPISFSLSLSVLSILISINQSWNWH